MFDRRRSDGEADGIHAFHKPVPLIEPGLARPMLSFNMGSWWRSDSL